MSGISGAFTRSSATSYSEGLRKYMLGVYNYMTLALAISGFTAFFMAKFGLAYAMATSPFGLIFSLVIPIGIVFYMSTRLMSADLTTLKNLFFVYSISIGASLSTLFLMFSALDITRAFFITSATFGAMSIYGYTTRKDLSTMSSFFTMSLIGIIIASLINIFTKSNALTMLLSFASVLLFTGLVAFDTQNLKRTYYSVGGNKDMSVRLGIMGALQLYMDFINIFVNLLQLFGMSNRSRD